jgi:hypothetical protein
MGPPSRRAVELAGGGADHRGPPPAAETLPEPRPERPLSHDLLTIAVTGAVFTLSFLAVNCLASR